MPIAALCLYAVWFALAFGVRTLIALRRTGDAGWRGLSGRPFGFEWTAGVLFAGALVAGVAAPGAALAGLDPVVESDVVAVGGTALAVVGILLTLGAQLSMGDSWRIGVDDTERTELVTAGAFALARNPIFTAMAITAAGLALMVPNALAVIGFAALIIALEMQIRGVEEPYLRRVHGESYQRYAAAVGRFIPGLGRLGPR